MHGGNMRHLSCRVESSRVESSHITWRPTSRIMAETVESSHRASDLSHHGGTCRVESHHITSHHITSHHMATSRIRRRNDVDLRGTIARIATGDHMSSKHSLISIGGSRSGGIHLMTRVHHHDHVCIKTSSTHLFIIVH